MAFHKSRNPKHDTGREGDPVNTRLWAAIVLQAKARFNTYPSPAAASWVHRTYAEKGGAFSKSRGRR